MKILLLILIAILPSSIKAQTGKADLFCQKWMEYSYMAYNEKTPKPVSGIKADTVRFFKDGTFEWAGPAIKGKGYWCFNTDTTKFTMLWYLFNGNYLKEVIRPLPTATMGYIIQKLTNDKLVYAEVRDYGGFNVLFFKKAGK